MAEDSATPASVTESLQEPVIVPQGAAQAYVRSRNRPAHRGIAALESPSPTISNFSCSAAAGALATPPLPSAPTAPPAIPVLPAVLITAEPQSDPDCYLQNVESEARGVQAPAFRSCATWSLLAG